MKGFLEEYGLIIVVVAVILLMLLFSKSGYAKSIQDAILGSANHIVETGENITKSDKKDINFKTGDLIDIDGTRYVVIEQKESSNYLVMTASSIGRKSFQTTFRQDRWNRNTYEGSEIDNYLENTWYKGLSTKMQSAIQATNIKQVSYSDNSLDSEHEDGYYYATYNTINRHVFLPSIKEMAKVVDLSSGKDVQNFLNGEVKVLSRDGHKNYETVVMTVYYDFNHIYAEDTDSLVNTRPAFVIDLSQVDYTEAGHVDYK